MMVCMMFLLETKETGGVVEGVEESIYKALLLAWLLRCHSPILNLPLPEELEIKEFFHCPLFFRPYDCFYAQSSSFLGPSSACP
jgi:hypothetical protein